MAEIDVRAELHRRRDEKQARVSAVTTASRPDFVRVLPRDSLVRKHIKHPSGIGFDATGSAEWPRDQFTMRRLKDGAIKIEVETAEPEGMSARQAPASAQRKQSE